MNLLIEFFDSFDRRRNAENLLTLHENTGNPLFDRIHLFVDDVSELHLSSNKFEVIRSESRPTFLDLFEYCNENLRDQVCLIANSDIIFNNSLLLAERLDFDKTFLALSRWEIKFKDSSFEYELFNNAASQDAWIFRAPVPTTTEMSFPMGKPGCDNRIARLMHDAGFIVRNPAKRIVAVHFHLNEHRSYTASDRVPGPYLLVPPTDSLNGGSKCIEIDSFDAQGNPVETHPKLNASSQLISGSASEDSQIDSFGMSTTQTDERVVQAIQQPRRILFDHLPKCGGTTVTEYLARHYSDSKIFTTNGRDPQSSIAQFRLMSEEIRHRLRLITGHETKNLLGLVHPETLAITVLRDPVERIISHYRYVLMDEEHYLHDQVMQKKMSLHDYAQSRISPELRNWYTTHFTGRAIEEIESDPDAAIKEAIGAIANSFDLIGFLDELPEFMQELQRRAQLTLPFENKILRKSSGDFNLSQVTQETKEVIAEVNSVDVKLYQALRRRLSNSAQHAPEQST